MQQKKLWPLYNTRLMQHYTLMIEKLQRKLDKYLDEDSEEDEPLATFANALDDASE